jgi:methyltransferase (TIGR00027 family)
LEKTQVSTTSKGIAAMRASESEKPADARICYDPFARRFAGTGFYLLSKAFLDYAERRAPGVSGFIVCRCRYFDDYLDACLRSGISQVVILGAGLDSRAYRGRLLQEHVPTFEVDAPATQADKMERVGKVLGTRPAHVRYVPIDFNEETLDKLLSEGFDRSKRTLFMWEGVTYYLGADAVDATLGWIASNAASGSPVIFDYVHASALAAEHQRGEISRMQRYRRFTGEGFDFGIEEGGVEAFLTSRGFAHVVDIGAEGLKRLYCTGPNEGRTVADVYSILHAEVA